MITGGPGRAAPIPRELADSCSIYDHHGQCARLHAPGGGRGRSNCVSDGHTDRQMCNTRGRSDASDHRPVPGAGSRLVSLPDRARTSPDTATTPDGEGSAEWRADAGG